MNTQILRNSSAAVARLMFIFFILSTVGCGGGGGGGTPAPPAANQRPTATATLSISATSARVGDSVTLQWSSTNATACTASGAWTGARATSGSETITASQVGASTYLLTCTGAGAAGNASATLDTLAALRQVNVPGSPVPLTLTEGACAPTTNANYSITCVTTSGGIESFFDQFSGDFAARVTLTDVNAQPVVTSGGTCFAGFDRAGSQFRLNSAFRNELIPLTGATVTKIVYSSAFLQSLGVQGTISSMSILLFQDTSNTSRIGMIAYIDGTSGPLTFAVGGTVSDAAVGGFDFITCFSEDQGTPPPPQNLECPVGFGTGRNGLEFLPGQQLQYQLSNGAASSATQGAMTWGVRYNNPNVGAGSYTGSLRVSLWALDMTFPGSGEFTGYRILEASPNFTGAGARSATQLYNFYSVSNIVSNISGTTPPAGDYCMVMLLEMYDEIDCKTDDNFCYVDWLQFDGVQSF